MCIVTNVLNFLESGKLTEQNDYIGMWSTNNGFKKASNYTYVEIPRYFKIGTVSDAESTNSYVVRLALGFALFLFVYFFVYFTIKHATIASHLFVVI